MGGFVMLRGKCPKCGWVCFGWALQNKQHQTCRECGTRLDIEESDDKCPENLEGISDANISGLEGDLSRGHEADE